MFAYLYNIVFKKFYLDILERNIDNNATVLELGAGKTTFLRNINKNLHITAIDIHLPSIEYAQQHKIYDNYIHGDVFQNTHELPPKSFDYVVAIDLIEHFEKDKGYELLKIMETLSVKGTVIFTPNGFVKQEIYDNNPFQEHLSGWSYEEMKKLGYKTYGVFGLKWLRGPMANPIIKPRKLGIAISHLSWIFLKLFRMDKYAFSILCVKKMI